VNRICGFQWAPTLEGECYGWHRVLLEMLIDLFSMGTHPWG